MSTPVINVNHKDKEEEKKSIKEKDTNVDNPIEGNILKTIPKAKLSNKEFEQRRQRNIEVLKVK
ncbi:MAG: hypothetical protein PHG53_09475 [Phycisphaerae bacterium]|nr:hypothetical protein [Phycisphaerae bacterium]